MSEQKTIAEFIAAHPTLTMATTQIPERPASAGGVGWPGDARHFRCTFRYQKRQMIVTFSQGPAHTKNPELADVLNCLASDASGYDNSQTFEDWCGEYGYDADSRSAERTFKAVQRQTLALERLLEPEAFTALIHTERL